jgi:glycosyltransferase involved in cell wall biosynthesis
MRIAMLAPLIEPVPPPQYGGTERVVSVLTEELVRRGHEVTLFASGDSITSADLRSTWPRGLRLDPDITSYIPYELAHVARAYAQASEFDVIHNHLGWMAFPCARLAGVPTVSTVHGRLDLTYTRAPYELFPEQRLISISNSQRKPLPDGSWVSTVYNGVDVSRFQFSAEPGDYLVFLGRISPEKRPDRAIAIAREAGMRLVIAAKVDPADREYYQQYIAPLIERSPHVDFIGEVNDVEKDALLGGAFAYLFPIDWPEPFGLTMVESMATGTPVVAWRAGSVAEVVVNGVTGYIRDSMAGMVDAVQRVSDLDRAACRAHVERRFEASQMVDGYERAYQRVAADGVGAGVSDARRRRRTLGLRSSRRADRGSAA